jgi:hypothetical protein
MATSNTLGTLVCTMLLITLLYHFQLGFGSINPRTSHMPIAKHKASIAKLLAIAVSQWMQSATFKTIC